VSDDDNIFREVEDDLRRERYERLWKKFGPFVIGTIAVVLVSMIGWQQWNAWQDRQRAKEAEAFLAAVGLLEDNKEAAAANAFAELAEKSGSGYRVVARLHQAQAHLEQGNPDQALAAFDAVAADSSANAKLRGLAALKGALLLADAASPEELKKRLTPALRPNSPWRYAAQEIVAYAHYRAGRIDEARNAYQGLINEFNAPSHIRDRARNMTGLIASEKARSPEEPPGGEEAGGTDGAASMQKDSAAPQANEAAGTASEADAAPAEGTDRDEAPQ
jgi:hypothetical protein